MGNASVTAYRFGEFVLNLERGCLQRDGIDLELRPKAFDVLRHLVERAGRLASKDELVELIWPNVTVSDDSLAQCVRDIRRLLDDEKQRFIRTVPRRGYMFAAEVEPIEDGRRPGSPQRTSTATTSAGRRWHFHSFAAGLAMSILFVVAWLGVTRTLAPTEAARPKYPAFLGNKTVLDQALVYPSGKPLLKAMVHESSPGDTLDWHEHETPTFAYILEGEISVDYGSRGVRVFRAGDGLLEALDWPHKVSNRGRARALILSVYMGVEGTDFSIPVATPK